MTINDSYSTHRYYLKVIDKVVRKVSKDTEGATLIFDRSLSAAKLQFMLKRAA